MTDAGLRGFARAEYVVDNGRVRNAGMNVIVVAAAVAADAICECNAVSGYRVAGKTAPGT